MKIFLIGWHGKYNIGDDIMLDIISWGAYKYWNVKKIYVLASPSCLNDNESGRAKVIGIVTRNRIQNYINKAIAVIKSDALVFGGGSIYHAVNSCRWKYFYTKLFKLIHRKGRVGSIGVSVGPFKEVEEVNWCKKLLKEFNFLIVRDKKSFELANKMLLPYEVQIGFDLSVLYFLSHNTYTLSTAKNEQVNIGFSILNYDKFKGEEYSFDISRNKKIKEVIKTLVNKDLTIKIRLFVLCKDKTFGDEEPANEIYQEINDINKSQIEIIKYVGDPKSIIYSMSECNVIISMRLHGSVLAYLLNKPLLMISYHNKCLDFAEYVGMEKKYILDRNNFSADELLKLIDELLIEKKGNFKLSLNKAQNLAIKNFSHISI